MSHEDLINKLRKLMALADPSRGATEAEATVATQKMNALLAEHNLDLASITDAPSEIVEEFVEATVAGQRSSKWARWIYQACAQLNYCDYFYYRNSLVQNKSGKLRRGIKHVVIGRQANVIVARETAEYLLTTVHKLALAAGKYQYGTHVTTQEGRAEGLYPEYFHYVKSFCHGAAARLCQRIAQMIVDAKAGKAMNAAGTANLPALASLYDREKQAVSAYMKQEHSDCTVSKNRKTSVNQSGYYAGLVAGDGIGLDRQVGGNDGTQRRIG